MQTKKNPEGYVLAEEVRWLTGGPDFFELLADIINRAQKSLSLYFYILSPDSTGLKVLEQLKTASARGVQVTLLFDDFASDEFNTELEADLKKHNIHIHRFEPLFSTSNTYIGRRMHAKVIVADNREALVGGINIADRYHGSPEELPWLDYAMYVKGEICEALNKWGNALMHPFHTVHVPKFSFSHGNEVSPDPSQLWSRITVNDFAKNRREITGSYNKALRQAKTQVTIVGGYFLPGRRFRRLLRQARARGVEINIIVTRISDVPVTRLAAEYLYGRLLKNGIRLFEYRDAMLHGKAAVVDDTWMTIGSYNQNPLSAYLSIELNIDVVNSALAKNFRSHLDGVILNHCEEVTPEKYEVRAGWWNKLKRWVSYRLVKWSLRLLFLASRIKADDD